MDETLKTSRFRVQTLALIVKELRQLMRDRQLLSLLFLMPVIQTLVYGLALSPEVEHVRLGVIDLSASPVSREVISALVENGVFDLLPAGPIQHTLAEKVRNGKLDAGVILPPELQRLVDSGRTASIQVFLDGVDANTAGIASGYIAQIMNAVNRQLAGHALRPPVAPQISFAYNPGLLSMWFFVPGVMALVLTIVSTLVSSAAVIREKDTGTLEQLLMAPVSSLQILLAKVVPLSLVLMLNVMVSLTVAVTVFSVPFRGNPILFAGVSFLAVLVGISIGIALAAFSENQRQSLLTSFFINLPVIQLSGAVAPLESMPDFFKALSLLNPLRYYVTCVRAILLKGAGLAEIWPNVLALALFAVVFMWASTSRFRKQLD